MKFDGNDYTIDKGVVKHAVGASGWGSEPNLPTAQHGGARSLDVAGGILVVTCEDGTQYTKRGRSHGWTKKC